MYLTVERASNQNFRKFEGLNTEKSVFNAFISGCNNNTKTPGHGV